MTNALMVITALAQCAGRIQLMWVWVLQCSWKTVLLAFVMTGSPVTRIYIVQVVIATPGGMAAVPEGYSMNATAVPALTVNLYAVKAQRPKDVWIMAVTAPLIAKKWTACATSAVLLAGNTCLVLLTTVAEQVLLFPFPVAWASP